MSTMAKGSRSIICTLFEREYHYGLAALVNSICRSGYQGTVYVGYRGDLPPWVSHNGSNGKSTEFHATDSVSIKFISLSTDMHLGNYKPEFMLRLLDEECPEAEACFYFDPDIIVLCRWNYFDEWALGGVALCADFADEMGATHPVRNAWRRYFEPLGLPLKTNHSLYFNSGFVGISRRHRDFVDLWRQAIELSRPAAGDLKYLNLGDRTLPFCIPDQDCMNVAAMACESPISYMGRDAMGFTDGITVMVHPVGKPKPWEKNQLWAALRFGHSPNHDDRTFLAHAGSPISAYKPWRFWLKRGEFKTARLLARAMRS